MQSVFPHSAFAKAAMLAAALAGLAAAPAEARRRVTPRPVVAAVAPDLLRSCPGFRDVAIGSLPATGPDRARLIDAALKLHNRLQGPVGHIAFEHLRGPMQEMKFSDSVVRIAGWNGRHGSRTSVVAWRYQGQWTVSASLDGEGLRRHLRAGAPMIQKGRRPLSYPDGARLEALLRDACLVNQPAYMPAVVPLTSGAARACSEGSTTFIEVGLDHRWWSSLQQCRVYAPVDQIEDLLWTAAGLR